jgi:quinohemoprotein ethanol dehydrogenase
VLTYKLGGKAQLPPPEHKQVALPAPPVLTADAATVDHGREVYNGTCGLCHGVNAIGGGVIPDLRYLSPHKHQIFNGIVAGAYARKGMPAFTDILKPEDIEAVHQYIIKRAHDLDDELKAAKQDAAPAGMQ